MIMSAEKRKGMWYITYTPPGGGTGYSLALSWYAPNICYDHEKFEEVRAAAEKVVASQLDNLKHPQYINRHFRDPDFGLAWIEKYEI